MAFATWYAQAGSERRVGDPSRSHMSSVEPSTGTVTGTATLVVLESSEFGKFWSTSGLRAPSLLGVVDAFLD
jgi:hypothetical protein